MADIKAFVRIVNTDLDGNKGIYLSLRKIKGVSYSFSNAVLNNLKIPHNKKTGLLSEDEIKKLEGAIKKPNLPEFLLNRNKDPTSGENIHLSGIQTKFIKDQDIKILRRIKAYRGVRHASGQPSRGQRTRGHFRSGKAVGVSKKKAKGKKAGK